MILKLTKSMGTSKQVACYIEHIHNFSWYIGNYPGLDLEKIDVLHRILKEVFND